MELIKQLHDEAMYYCQLAIMAYNRGSARIAKKLYKKALPYEVKAATLLGISEKNEPSRSILYRSAANIAFNCDLFEDSRYLAIKGITRFAPPKIKDELWDILNKF